MKLLLLSLKRKLFIEACYLSLKYLLLSTVFTQNIIHILLETLLYFHNNLCPEIYVNLLRGGEIYICSNPAEGIF